MKYILFDCSFLCHRARFTTGALDNGVIFGFLSSVIDICEAFECYNPIFIWDSKKSHRKKIFPYYKKKRRKDLTPEELLELKECFRQMDVLRSEIIPDMGFKNSFRQTGLEGDDLIAKIVLDMNNSKHRFIIVSSDQDLY